MHFFVLLDILVLLNGACLWTFKLLGINTEVSGIGHELLWILHDVGGKLSVLEYWMPKWLELMSCVTSLTDGGCQESSLIEWYHFANMPVFWQDDVIGTGFYYCT